MSQPAEQIIPPAPIITPQAPLGNARPKVMRRPAALARSAEAAEVLSFSEVKLDYIPLHMASQPAEEAPAKHWQEDARFGLVLLGFVVVANLVAAVLLAPAPSSLPVESSQPSAPATPITFPHVNVLDHKAR